MSTIPRMTGRVLRNGLPGLFALLAGIVLFEFVQPVVSASFGGAAGLVAILERIPPAFQVFMRTRPEFLALSGLAGYLSHGFTHPPYIVLAGAAGVRFAARALAGEMDRGIIQIALSRPISRQSLYVSRLLGVALICVTLALAGPVGMVAGVLFSQPNGEFQFEHLVAVSISSLALFWAIGALTLCGSAAASTGGRIVAWALSLIVFSYFIDYFASIWIPLQSITFLSLFEYYEPTQALVTGEVSIRNVATLAIVGAVASVVGLGIFTRRDLPS